MPDPIPTNTKNTSNPYKRDTYETYVAWRSIPAFMRQAKHKGMAAELKLEGQPAAELLAIRTQGEFAKAYGVEQSTLSNWNRLIDRRDALVDSREWAGKFTKNVVLALYRNAMKTGNARSVELFFKVVNGWTPRQQRHAEYKGVTQFNIQGIKNG